MRVIIKKVQGLHVVCIKESWRLFVHGVRVTDPHPRWGNSIAPAMVSCIQMTA